VGEENEVTGGDKVGFNEIGDIVVEKNEQKRSLIRLILTMTLKMLLVAIN
jgi:hypothetical protein